MTGARHSYPELAGRVVIVTGAAGGLGRAVADGFAAQGAHLVLCDLDAGALGLAGDGQAAPPDRVLAVAADLRDPAACEALVDAAASHFGRIDVLVNNAAVLHRMPIEQVTPKVFDEVVAVNLRAPFFLARAALRHMRPAGWGRIINVASVAARTGGASDVFPYAASKGGLVALTKSLAKLAASDGVLVNAILPAGIDTPMITEGFPAEAIEAIVRQIPLGRLSPPSEMAGIVLWLASDAAGYVTGASFDVNGGWVMT
jgi:NAD(P)-dependent dehydrogenase (short-subunit alcohol dehydrogenase family)